MGRQDQHRTRTDMVRWLPDVEICPSPHFSNRHHDVAGLVIHYTGGSHSAGDIRWMCSPRSGLSAHFQIARSGKCTQMVALNKAAWHAGLSEWQYEGETVSGCNSYTIGIELGNLGLLATRDDRLGYKINNGFYKYPDRLHPPVQARLEYDPGHAITGWWEPYSGPQIYALARLVEDLKGLYPGIPLIGHEEVGMPLGRKKDPGPLFPWEAFDRTDKRRTEGVLLP